MVQALTSGTHQTGFRPPTALTIAGTDPTGGAGVQADLKTFTAHATMGTSIITNLLAQNTHGVSRVYPVDIDFVRDQFVSVFDDIAIDASKTGMLGSWDLVNLVIQERNVRNFGFYTADPVMTATSGAQLIDDDTVELIREELLPLTDLITPNLGEAALLLGDHVSPAESPEQMAEQAMELVRRGPSAVLLKGGHLSSATVTDVLVTATGFNRQFHQPRISTRNTHGTGCTLSAAITSEIAQAKHVGSETKVDDAMLCRAVVSALEFLTRALTSAADWAVSLHPPGSHGPVDHQVAINRSCEL